MDKNKNLFWLVDGATDFAMAPGFDGFPPAPIRLHNGNELDFGAIHIGHRHPDVVKKLKAPHVPGAVWWKLQQNGPIYCSEVRNRVKIILPIGSNMLLVMDHRGQRSGDPYWSVTTFYQNRQKVDGEEIARFVCEGRSLESGWPAFKLDMPKQPTIQVKRKRKLILPK